jgi:hypothetical protein
MHMSTQLRYLPTKEEDLANYCNALGAGVSTAMGLTTAQITSLTASATAYATALAPCLTMQRSPSAVAAKNAAKTSLKVNVREIAGLLKGNCAANGAPTLAQLNALGIPAPQGISPAIYRQPRGRISAPKVAPHTTIINQTSLCCLLAFTSGRKAASTAMDKKKPHGVKTIALYYKYEDTQSWIPYPQQPTRSPFEMVLPPDAAGRSIQICAAFVTGSGLIGPKGNIVRTQVCLVY